MRIRSRARTSERPRTYVGRWLLAGLLDHSAERDRLSRTLNNGKKGWNSAEPVVVGYTFELAIRQLFPGSVDVREITEFVRELRARVHSVTPPDQLEAEALIRDGLGEDVDISGIGVGKIFTTHTAILGYAVLKLGLKEPEITQLIVDGEKIAFEKGWKPPLAE